MTTTDHIFINGVLVFTLGPFTATAFSSSTSGFITLHPTDVLTLEMVISKPTSTGSSTFTATGNKNFTAVPDGGSAVALLGIALVGVETLRRKLKAA